MSYLRALGSIARSDLQENEVEYWEFVSFAFSSGTLRFTNYPGGYTGDIDGSSQDWDNADIRIGAFRASLTDPLAVSWVDLWNLDYAFSNKASDIRGTAVEVYIGWFSSGALVDSVALFSGEADDCNLGERARITVKPFGTPWGRSAPWRRIAATCPYNFKDARCAYAGADTTCDRDVEDCTSKSNTARFGGHHLLPEKFEVILWGQ